MLKLQFPRSRARSSGKPAADIHAHTLPARELRARTLARLAGVSHIRAGALWARTRRRAHSRARLCTRLKRACADVPARCGRICASSLEIKVGTAKDARNSHTRIAATACISCTLRNAQPMCVCGACERVSRAVRACARARVRASVREPFSRAREVAALQASTPVR
eukprot:9486128-Pyramimonas_sp.AAC.1